MDLTALVAMMSALVFLIDLKGSAVIVGELKELCSKMLVFGLEAEAR